MNNKKYLDLEVMNRRLANDKREAFSKHEVWCLLNYNKEAIVDKLSVEKMEKNKSLKYVSDLLRNVNRYDDILYVLNNIMIMPQTYFPVHQYLSKGVIHKTVPAKEVIVEASKLQIALEYNIFIIDTLDNLGRCIKYRSDTLLHDYAIAISHRKYMNCGKTECKMEHIRTLLLLNHLIGYFNNITEENIDDLYDFYIPDGWEGIKKEDTNNGKEEEK